MSRDIHVASGTFPYPIERPASSGHVSSPGRDLVQAIGAPDVEITETVGPKCHEADE